MKSLVVIRKEKILKGSIELPASKSISNRLLLIRALSQQDFPVENLSVSEDTRLMVDLLSEIHLQGEKKNLVELNTANAGTVMRFLTAYLAFRPGSYMVTGSERMKQRPIGILVEALISLGADIEYLEKPGFPPLLIHGKKPRGRQTQIDPGVSSQYISALMMIAPLLPEGLEIRMKGHAVSVPYLDMTAGLMKYFGASLDVKKDCIRIFPGNYLIRPFTVEADWSAAAFWYEAASLAGEVDLELKGLVKNSLQGDAILFRIFQNFGVQTDFSQEGVKISRSDQMTNSCFFDFNDYPDIAPAVITTCAVLGLHGRFEGLKSLKIKESDRLIALENEFMKLGIRVMISNDETPTLELKEGCFSQNMDLVFETYGDHRMAMTFAMLAMINGKVRIINPDVVTKSYPDFWEHLRQTGFDIK